ncbi:PSD1 and planctomycete cytochrome C domain-containing protein [Stieleria varia]|nr:PSD1 and planctomycete cytochrome C domain-containing protein [Stieleria varia]
MFSRLYLPCVVAILCAVTSIPVSGEESSDSAVDFSRDIRPILSDHCFACHGPDEHERQADLRLDTADGIQSVVSMGNAVDSELIERLLTDDPDVIMPPPKFNKPISDAQRKLLEEWVQSGATFQQHWSFVKPEKAQLPDEAVAPIDYFINRSIRRMGLTANPTADRNTLIRRACLDLTGLPPTQEQLAEFLADESPDAYEKLIDRLLASPAFGQHMGRYWLDLVRYADTHGLHLDNYREMWPYRDWVIDAINDNMPFDEFITTQLAGDLLPDATLAQKIASGYNRLNVTTSEGGSIYEEVFARNVIDRTDAFGTVFLGLTTGCSVCHDHKFDPIAQRDYYSLFAFFNSLDGQALDKNIKDPPPVIQVPSDQQLQLRDEYQTQLQQIRDEMKGPIASVDDAQRRWEESLGKSAGVASRPLKPDTVTSSADIEMEILDDGSFRVKQDAADRDTTTIVASIPSGAWSWLRLDALVDAPDQRVGLSTNGNVVLSEITIEARPSADAAWQPLKIEKAIANIEQSDGPFAVTHAIDGNRDEKTGWAAAGHQSTGPRDASFFVPALSDDPKLQTGDAQIRVALEYQSVHAKHQFRHVLLSLSDSEPAIPDSQRITFGPVHSVGPFPVEAPEPAYSRQFASQEKEFKADEVFSYRDRDYRWQLRGDLAPVKINELPKLAEEASVMIVHQTIDSPEKQNVKLLFGSDDGHVLYLNGKQVAVRRGAHKMQPLQQEYELELNKGSNRLYLKFVQHDGEARYSYAIRSPKAAVPESLKQLAAQPPAERTDVQNAALRRYYREALCAEPDWLALRDHESGLIKAQEKLESEIPTTLVWKETAQPREAKILLRGQYDQPGDVVPRATPTFLPPMPTDAPTDRLGLARWLCSPEHPLTARVAVNRFWQNIFGTALVKTSEDFGSQGEVPSHPGLLDFLAVDFQENGWDVKRLIKSIVMSETYRRTSTVNEHDLRIDPRNRYLARAARRRLDAEVLRDQALAVAGMLNLKHGGPSVKPPQPSGLWYAVGYTRSNTANFIADTDPDKTQRRSVYIFWKRTSAPPQMSTFDAPSRESCTARRERTNTPLQALLLMNETQYLQAAKHLATRTLNSKVPQDASNTVDSNTVDTASVDTASVDTASVDTDDARLRWMFQTVTIRSPSDAERHELRSLLDELLEHYRDDPGSAKSLLAVDDSEVSGDPATHAAWMIVASTLLNMDEVVSTP